MVLLQAADTSISGSLREAVGCNHHVHVDGLVTFCSVLQAIVTPGSFMPLIGSAGTWAPLSAIPTSKLSITLQTITSIFPVPTRSAIPFLHVWRGLRRVFQLFLVLFVILVLFVKKLA